MIVGVISYIWATGLGSFLFFSLSTPSASGLYTCIVFSLGPRHSPSYIALQLLALPSLHPSVHLSKDMQQDSYMYIHVPYNFMKLKVMYKYIRNNIE